MSETIVSIKKAELTARAFNPCKLNGEYAIEITSQKKSAKGWLAFNCKAVADDKEQVVTIGAQALSSVPSPLWKEVGDSIEFSIGAAAQLTFQYVDGDFASTILAAGAPAKTTAQKSRTTK